jgi:hypothetical protein
LYFYPFTVAIRTLIRRHARKAAWNMSLQACTMMRYCAGLDTLHKQGYRMHNMLHRAFAASPYKQRLAAEQSQLFDGIYDGTSDF